MPRKGHIAKPEVLPDPIYNSKLVTSMINHLMLDGKRGTASKILYQAFNEIKDQTGNDPVEVFEQAIENVQPALEVKARRIGGSNYQVPIEVRPDRQRTLALRWLTQFARLRGEHTMVQRLAAEIIDASNNTGASIKKKEDTLRMAEANRAFAHYRW
ncbi:MAG TPA: 30S ribosomal protein S7 [Limosilactobacillus coleohominis]|uniref:Small ribosomal subunit protein uS7 n=1 Tax=Limosilactobacillus coleohominis 101-4-CHN TaxID=575594 RepID=C7XVQ8_9LACO|nr:30S ribosomal protein S7 [Limosilactobacillus coleohominis]EEU30424.1 ribosomal protein S7 [Limosilactobacillus coleohominis 101-4-CHN]HJF54088.1 30S ribosomal protein S7 [Limosilactobacillus coleohominis]